MKGIDVARLGLRVTIGATMIAHGVRHGRTLDGTAPFSSPSSGAFPLPPTRSRILRTRLPE